LNGFSVEVEYGVVKMRALTVHPFGGVLGSTPGGPQRCRSKFHTYMSSSLKVTRRSPVSNILGH